MDKDREKFLKEIWNEVVRIQLRNDLSIWFRCGDIGPQASAMALRLKLESWKDWYGMIFKVLLGNTISDEQIGAFTSFTSGSSQTR